MSNQTVPSETVLEQTSSTGSAGLPLSPTSTSSSRGPAHSPSVHSGERSHRRAVSHSSSIFSSGKRFFRSRSSSPAPMQVQTGATSSTAAYRDTRNHSRSRAASAEHPQRTTSPVPMSPGSRPQSPASPFRSGFAKHGRHPSRVSSNGSEDDWKRYNGTVNHLGRHGNDWLFGGFSVRDTIRGFLHHENKE